MRFSKQRRAYYEGIIERSLIDLYRKMERDIEPLPDHIDLENKEHEHIVKNVWSIESEWMLDPRQRDALSLIQFDD